MVQAAWHDHAPAAADPKPKQEVDVMDDLDFPLPTPAVDPTNLDDGVTWTRTSSRCSPRTAAA